MNIKILLGAIIIAIAFYFACNQPTKSAADSEKQTNNHNSSQSVAQPPMSQSDSLNLFAVDNQVKFIESNRNKWERKDLNPNIISPNDHLFISINGKKIQQAVVSLKPEGGSQRHYFFIDNDEIIFYRNLKWQIAGIEQFAQETIVFFSGDNIFNIEDRRIDLTPGQSQSALLGMKFTRPEVNKEELKNMIRKEWNQIKKIILQEDNSLIADIKNL